MHRFPIGLYLPQDVAPERVIAIAQGAEHHGLDSVWAADHLHQFPDKQRGRLEAWMLLSAVAAETTTVRLGTGVCNVQLRNPRLVAKMACTLDVMSKGRLQLALGTGGNAREMRAYGYTPEKDSGARARLTETIRAIRNLSTGQWEETFCRPASRQQPLPVAVAGDHPETLRIVANDADWWYANLATPEAFAKRNRALSALCVRAQRQPSTLKRNAHVLVILGETAQAAEAAAERYMRQPRARLFETPHIVGDAGRLADGLRRYRDAGADRICVYILNLAEADPNRASALVSTLGAASRLLSQASD